MKFSFNPALFSEAVRQVVLALVLFGIIKWTEPQIAGALMALSAVLALFTVSNTTANSQLEAAGTSKTQIHEAAKANTDAGTPGGTGSPNTPGGAGGPTAPRGLGNFSSKDSRGTGSGLTPMIALLILTGSMLFGSACASNSNPNLSPERKVALYGIQAGKYLAEVKTSADNLYSEKLLPEAAYRRTLEALVKVNEAGERLGAALKAYDAAVTAADRSNVVTQVNAALLALQALLPTVIPEGLPADVVARLSKGVNEVQRLMLTIARFTAPASTQLRPVNNYRLVAA